MQVRIEFQVRRGTLHSDDRATLRVLARAFTQTPAVPAEDGVDEQPRDRAEQLAVEGQAGAKLMRHREHPLPQWYGRKHVLEDPYRLQVVAPATSWGARG